MISIHTFKKIPELVMIQSFGLHEICSFDNILHNFINF